jgi:Zn-dependent metalloprotease
VPDRKRRKRLDGLSYQNLEVRNLLASVDGSDGAIYLFDQPVPVAERFDVLQDHLQLGDNESFRLVDLTRDQIGYGHLRYQQYADGVPVEGGRYSVHAQDQSIVSFSGHYIDFTGEFVAPADRVGAQSALDSALAHVDAEVYLWNSADAQSEVLRNQNNGLPYDIPEGELVYFTVGDEGSDLNGQQRLAYKFDIYSVQPLGRDYVFIDAETGDVLGEYERFHAADVPATGTSLYNGTVGFLADSTGSDYRLQQTTNGVETYDLNGSTNYGDAVDITSSSTSFTASDVQTGVQAHFGAESTLEYFNSRHGRDSYDGNGAILRSYVSYSTNYVNAFWNGSAMTYGDGDGTNYGPLVSLDIVGHEITHGVTEFSAGLIYQNESGALNESFSDIFGESVEAFALGANDWLMGDDIGIGSSGAIRSMSNPNAFGDPDTYLGTNWFTGTGDNGGVHINSGVQNKWFYILSEGESGTNDVGFSYDVDGIGIDDAAAIAYRNLSVYLAPSSNYEAARVGAIQSAIDLFGLDSQQHQSTAAAWDAVNVLDPTNRLLPSFSRVGAEEVFSYLTTATDTIESGTPLRIFPVDLEANQQLSIRVAGSNGLAPEVTVTAPDGTEIGIDGSGGNVAVLQSLPVLTAGTYSVSVSGVSGSTGNFSLDVLLNGSFESEGFSGIDNDVLANAAPVGAGIEPGTFAPTSLGDADRTVVVGSLVGEGGLFSDGFESGAFSSDWTTSSSLGIGQIQLTGDYGTDSGSVALVMAVDASGTYNLNEAVLTLDLSTATQPVLNFAHTQFGDETDNLPASFTGSADGDGVAISVDGTTWYTILDAPTTPADGQWVDVSYDLNSVAAAAGITLGSSVQVKFQQYDNYSFDFDGRGYDSIEVVDIAGDSSAQDWYSFEVAQQQPVSLAVQRTGTAGGFGLSLYDGSGNLLSAGTSTNNYESFIDRYSVDAGTYYVEVSGGGAEEYALAVGRGLAFDAEVNDDASTAQDISGTEGVLGSLGFESVDGIVDPDSASDGDDISNLFPGITLSENLASGPIYAAAASFAPTGNLVFASTVGGAAGFRDADNQLRADFVTPVSSVSIDVGSDDPSDVAYFQAYDAAGNLLDEQISGALAQGESETLTIQRSNAEIAYVIAAGVGTDITPLDNLVVGSGVSENDIDVYEVDIANGQTAEFNLLRLGSDPGLFDTNLDTSNTQISLYGPGGALIATDADTIVHSATQTGAYRIEVETLSPVAGTYYLHQSFDTPVAVIDGTYVFYDNSVWDGSGDAGAIAPDKSVFFEGQQATYANYTNTPDGITGVMVDIGGLAGTVTQSDFTFRTGTTDDTSTWTNAPNPSSIVVQPGAGSNGADRVVFYWSAGSITNTWLETTALANTNTGLAEDYTFYLGNIVGEIGNDPTSTRVNLIDVAQTRSNQSGFGQTTIDDPYDVNRSGRVDLVDVGLVRVNQTGFNTLPLITPTNSSNRSSSFAGGDVKDSSMNLFSTDQVSPTTIGRFASSVDAEAEFSVSTVDNVALSGATTISSFAFESTRDSNVDHSCKRDVAFESLASIEDELELVAF